MRICEHISDKSAANGQPDHRAGVNVTFKQFEEASMILVTGGTGLIGSELLRLLSQAGVPARALARNPQKAQTLPGIAWVAGDWLDQKR